MEWEYKGIRFQFAVEPLGPFFLASSKAIREGPFVRVRPFSALERSQEKALESLRRQIELEFRKVPDFQT